MGKADLHIHSTVSDGMAPVAQIMARVQESTDLDLVAIADHDAVAGALQAIEWVEQHPDCRFRAVFGTEITTAMGRHLLAYFFRAPYPTAPFPQLRSFRETIDLIHEAGGLAVVPHPTVAWTPSGGYRYIRGLLANGVRIEGVEVCNAAPGARGKEKKVREFNDGEFHLAELGGSDAHHAAQIASGYTSFEGRTAEELERALLAKSTTAHWGDPGEVPWMEHAAQLFKSWVEKPTRGLRSWELGGNSPKLP